MVGLRNPEDAALPRELAELVWRLVLEEFQNERLDGLLAECTLRSGRSGGRPVQEIRVWGRTYTAALSVPPMDRNLLVYMDAKGRRLLAA